MFCISEHWLYSYDSILFKEFLAFDYSVQSVIDDPVYVPKTIRGKGGVALMWSKSISSYVSSLTVPGSERITGIRIQNVPNDIFPVYLPCRSGCTDHFKMVLDELDSAFDLYLDTIIIAAGDFNADLGYTDNGIHFPPNEQGIILLRYIRKWDLSLSHDFFTT